MTRKKMEKKNSDFYCKSYLYEKFSFVIFSILCDNQRWAGYYILVYHIAYSIYISILYILQHFKKYVYIISNIIFFGVYCTL